MKYKTLLRNKIMNYTTLKNPKIYRPSSKPLISGDTFRKMANHIFDETQTLNPKRVKKKDIVFLKTDLKKIYFEHYHPLIENPYILISHNSDDSVSESDLNYLDSKILHWFAMKLNAEANNRISPIPSGLENARFRVNGKVKNFINISKGNNHLSFNKSKKILCSFNENTNFEERHPLLKIAEAHDEIDILRFENRVEYLNTLSNYKYNLCPEGNNYESHRIWETLYFSSTPIVLSNKVNNNFFSLDIPLLILNKWDELKHLRFSDLERMNQINSKKKYKEFSTFEYWDSFIRSKV